MRYTYYNLETKELMMPLKQTSEIEFYEGYKEVEVPEGVELGECKTTMTGVEVDDESNPIFQGDIVIVEFNLYPVTYEDGKFYTEITLGQEIEKHEVSETTLELLEEEPFCYVVSHNTEETKYYIRACFVYVDGVVKIQKLSGYNKKLIYILEEDTSKKTSRINDQLYNEYKNKRAKLLTDSDWTQVDDAPITAENKAAWTEYRLQLRMMRKTVTINNVASVVYPTAPSVIYKAEYI